MNEIRESHTFDSGKVSGTVNVLWLDHDHVSVTAEQRYDYGRNAHVDDTLMFRGRAFYYRANLRMRTDGEWVFGKHDVSISEVGKPYSSSRVAVPPTFAAAMNEAIRKVVADIHTPEKSKTAGASKARLEVARVQGHVDDLRKQLAEKEKELKRASHRLALFED